MIETQGPAGRKDIGGTVARGFERVREAFDANFAARGEVGASCCVYVEGKPVVDLWGGSTTPDGSTPYTGETLGLVASATKGVVTIAAHMLAEEGELDFDAPVTDYWPEFGAAGKQTMPVRWLFSHRAGLSAVDRPLTLADAYAWEPVIAALEAQQPLWEPNSTHGYHVGTFGYLAGELIRRVSGISVGRFVASRIAQPLRSELWIGLPEEQEARFAPMIPAPPPPPGRDLDVFTRRLLDPATLLHRAFANPPVPPSAFNDRAFHAAEIPAANGIANARALARIYAAAIGEVDGIRLLEPETLRSATEVRSAGEDLVLGYETRYSTGFQLAFPFRPMAGEGSFGFYGMGGSVGFAHPGMRMSFGYVINQMLPSGGPDPRSVALVQAVVASLR